MLLFVPEISSKSTSCPSLGGLIVASSLLSSFMILLISAKGWWLLLEVDLFPHSLSQPLCLSQALLGVGCSSGKLACHSASALSLCFFMHKSLSFQHSEFGSLSHSWSLGQVQHSTPTSTVSVRFQFAVYVFSFVVGAGGGVSLPGAALSYFPEELGGG
jgi:hypothetical protein